MSEQRQQLWRQVMALTEQLKQLSEEQHWDEMIQAETERKQLLETFFSQPVEAEDAAEIERGIEQILASNQQLLEHGQGMQQKAASGARKLATGRRAIKAYGQFQK